VKNNTPRFHVTILTLAHTMSDHFDTASHSSESFSSDTASHLSESFSSGVTQQLEVPFICSPSTTVEVRDLTYAELAEIHL
jgi:hypothetical protein